MVRIPPVKSLLPADREVGFEAQCDRVYRAAAALATRTIGMPRDE